MLTAKQYLDNPAQLKIGDIIIGKNGSKSAQVTTQNGKQICLILGTPSEPVTSPFGMSVFGDQPADRVSLDLRTSQEIDHCILRIDQAILKYVEDNAKKFFGEKITKDKIHDFFRPTVKCHEEGKYDPLIKCKLSKSRVKVWTPSREPASVEDIKPHSQMCVVLLVRSCYFQSKGFGLTLEVQHVQLADSNEDCPFEDMCGEEE